MHQALLYRGRNKNAPQHTAFQKFIKLDNRKEILIQVIKQIFQEPFG